MAKTQDPSLRNLLFLLESAIIEYELLYQENVNGFSVSSIRCLIRQDDLSLTNQYFIVINDSVGAHCVDWVIAFDFIRERFDYWKRFLELGHREVVEYSFPQIFPFRKWTLVGGVHEPNGTKQP